MHPLITLQLIVQKKTCNFSKIEENEQFEEYGADFSECFFQQVFQHFSREENKASLQFKQNK